MKEGTIVKTATDTTHKTIKSLSGDNAVCNWFVGTELMTEEYPLSELTVVSPDEIRALELELFEKALNDRAAELSAASNGQKVMPIWYLDPMNPDSGKPIVGYLKEPNRATKGSILDTMMVSQSRAATIALQASIMKEVSDERIWSISSVYDGVNMQAGLEALGLVKLAVSQFKKK